MHSNRKPLFYGATREQDRFRALLELEIVGPSLPTAEHAMKQGRLAAYAKNLKDGNVWEPMEECFRGLEEAYGGPDHFRIYDKYLRALRGQNTVTTTGD